MAVGPIARRTYWQSGLLARLRGLDLVESLAQGVPRQGGALDTHRELHHPLKCLEVPKRYAFVRRHFGRTALVVCRVYRSPRRLLVPPANQSASDYAAGTRPAEGLSLPGAGPSSCCPCSDIMARKALIVERAWARVLPFTATDIIEADD